MSETRMDESSLEFRMRAEQCRCAYQNGVTCACLAHIPMQDFRSLVSLAFRATPPAAETGERDFAQAERVAHVLAMGAEGLPPQDYRRIGVAYLALLARRSTPFAVTCTCAASRVLHERGCAAATPEPQ